MADAKVHCYGVIKQNVLLKLRNTGLVYSDWLAKIEWPIIALLEPLQCYHNYTMQK